MRPLSAVAVWGLAVVAALGLATIHPHAPAWTESASSARIEAAEAPGGITAVEVPDGALLVDARSADAFAAGHAEGAIHLDPEHWDTGFPDLLMHWTPGQPIVVYCDGGGCRDSQEVAERLRRELGVESVHHLRGGWPALSEGR